MNEKLQSYLEKKREENRARFESDRDARLIAAGLFEKRFSPTNKENDPEYPFGMWNKEEQRMMYYKKVAIPVTDEEYEEFLKVNPTTPAVQEEASSNGVATALKVIAVIIYILCGLVGLVAMIGNFVTGLVVMVMGFVSGTIFLGFGEIIKLLQQISDK